MTFLASTAFSSMGQASLLASSTQIPQLAADFFTALDHPVEPHFAIDRLRFAVAPLAQSAHAVIQSNLPEEQLRELVTFAREEGEPTAALLTVLTEHAELIKPHLALPQKNDSSNAAMRAELMRQTALADGLRDQLVDVPSPEALKSILSALSEAGLTLSREDYAALRKSLAVVLTNDVLADFPPAVREALVAIRDGNKLTPKNIEVLQRDARTIVEFRRETVAQHNAEEAMARVASAQRRRIAGTSRMNGNGEPITLTNILDNPEQFRESGVEISIYDYDGTLRRRRGGVRLGQVWAEWLLLDVLPHPKHSVGVSLIKTLALTIPGLINGVVEQVKGHADPESTKRIIAKALEMGDPDAFRASFDRFIKYYGSQGHSPHVMQCLKDDIQAGKLVIISSASPVDLVGGILEEFGVPLENVQGTYFVREEAENGELRLTGEFHWNHDEAKIVQLEDKLFQHLRAADIPFKVSSVYTDSPSDMALVELAAKYGGMINTTNSSRGEFEERVVNKYRGVAIREKSGLGGFLFGGGTGTLNITLTRQGSHEIVQRDDYREPRAPYLADWGRNLTHGAVTGTAYGVGTAVASIAHDYVQGDGAFSVADAMLNSGALSMGVTTAAASTLLNYFMVRDGINTPMMRRVWAQRVLPLMIGTSVAGIPGPDMLHYPGAALALGSLLFATQGLQWGRDIASLMNDSQPTSSAAQVSEDSDQAEDEPVETVEVQLAKVESTEPTEELAVAPRSRAARWAIATGIPLLGAAATGGGFYALGSSSFAVMLTSALAVGVGAELAATGARRFTRQTGTIEDDRSIGSKVLGRNMSKIIEMTAFRMTELLSRFL